MFFLPFFTNSKSKLYYEGKVETFLLSGDNSNSKYNELQAMYDYTGETYYKGREVLAIHKAVLDIYVIHPEYIGGEPEVDFKD